MDEHSFWITIWKMAAVTSVTIVLIIAGCDAYGKHKILQLVEAGVSPVEANCGLFLAATTGSPAICGAIAAKSME